MSVSAVMRGLHGEAVSVHGVRRGVWLGCGRLVRCQAVWDGTTRSPARRSTTWNAGFSSQSFVVRSCCTVPGALRAAAEARRQRRRTSKDGARSTARGHGDTTGCRSNLPLHQEPAAQVSDSAEREIVVQTATVEVVLTNRGGRVLHWRLKDYRDAKGNPVDLVPSDVPADQAEAVHAAS